MTQVPAERSVTDSSVAFGVGCFHFGLKRLPSSGFRGSEYVAELRAKLSSIKSVESLDIQYSDDVAAIEQPFSDDINLISEGLNWFPGWGDMIIRLRLRIPYRVQAELIKATGGQLQTYTEVFEVESKQFYHSPISFVVPVSPSERCEPSQAVQIVRELLESEFGQPESTDIHFDCLGPSPFHANFYIELAPLQGNFETGEFRSIETEGFGYKDIIFQASRRYFNSVQEAKHSLLSKIEPEIDLFYFLAQIRITEMGEWQNVESTIAELLTTKQEAGVWHSVANRLSSHRLLESAYRSVFNYQSFWIENFDEWQRTFAQCYSMLGRNSFLREHVSLEERELYKRPIEQRIQLLDFLEKRRQHVTQNFVVLMSALLGGLIGSFVTLALKK